MKAHPDAEIFPRMTDAEMQGLIADIREHGQREPITTYQGMILDGRNRWEACKVLGLEPRTYEWQPQEGDTTLAFVVSANLHRRHLNESQRAMLGARISMAIGRTGHENLKVGDNSGGDKFLPVGPTRDELAEMLNVSGSSISSAKVILAEGDAEKISRIASGKMRIHGLARSIRRRKRNEAGVPLNDRGGNIDRLEKARFNADLWSNLSGALLGLTSLPKPEDMVDVVRGHVKRRLQVDRTLDAAVKWLDEFVELWRKS